MRVLVTGGCGYVGSVLVPRLASLASEVTVLDLRPPDASLGETMRERGVTFHLCDASDPREAGTHFSRADYIIHLAALVGYPACNRDPELAIRSNVRTTKTLLRAKRPEARVLLASTISNYGEQAGMVDESSPVRPTSVYGKTKVRAEQLVRLEPQHIVYRFAGAFGSSSMMRDDLLIHDFVSKAIFGIPLSIYESHFVRQFIHVQDMAGAILFALANWEKMQGEIYNVGNPGIEITKRDLIEQMKEFLEFDYKFENSGSDLERRNYPVSFEKLLGKGFQPAMKLAGGVEELTRYYLAERERRALERRASRGINRTVSAG